jgi:hypothetical protein
MPGMQPEIVILSRTSAESYVPQGDEICVSITNPNSPSVQLSHKFRALLHLTFSDIAAPTSMPLFLLFSAEHASAILDFVAMWPDVERIVIHCVGGQGRSPAVAMGICELRDGRRTRSKRATPCGTRGCAQSSSAWVDAVISKAKDRGELTNAYRDHPSWRFCSLGGLPRDRKTRLRC